MSQGFPGRPQQWRGPLVEVDRVESGDPGPVLSLLAEHAGDVKAGRTGIGLLLGARGCAALGGVPVGAPSPVAVPECVAVAYRRADPAVGAPPEPTYGAKVGSAWVTSWTDGEHAEAVERVRAAISRGDVYQANVVGHRSARFTGDPRGLAVAIADLPGASYGGMVTGAGWVVASASPEQLVRVRGRVVTSTPIKGTAREREDLQASAKDRAEHVMIVDLARNDLARVTVPGSVEVEELYRLSEWAGLWHASTAVVGRLTPDATLGEVLAAVLPGGSVTGAPKAAACGLLAGLEPVGRGPSMGAMGFVWSEGLDLGLTIRTLAAADGTVHLWAGGGITWGSVPEHEVLEAHAKAAPVERALSAL